ncbi:MAG: hypothetical protein IJS21_05260, partial [Deltaproteobacteria bacterium]|nr:hypothetical protein [Deltaproteobacteria bacterium]
VWNTDIFPGNLTFWRIDGFADSNEIRLIASIDLISLYVGDSLYGERNTLCGFENFRAFAAGGG